MKSFVMAIIIIGVVFTGGILYTVYLSNLSEHLITEIEEVYEHIDKNHWDNAEETFTSVKNHFDKNSHFLYILIRHDKISDISNTFGVIDTYMDQNEKSHVMAYISMLKVQFENLSQEEIISFKNLL